MAFFLVRAVLLPVLLEAGVEVLPVGFVHFLGLLQTARRVQGFLRVSHYDYLLALFEVDLGN